MIKYYVVLHFPFLLTVITKKFFKPFQKLVFKDLFYFQIFICGYVSVWEDMKVSAGISAGQRHQVPMELKLQVISHPKGVPGIELGLDVEAMHALNF